MNEAMPERRVDRIELSSVMIDLSKTVADLKITVGELKITVGLMMQRDVEDRQAAKDIAEDVSDLKEWRARIRGQLALLWLAVTLVGGAVLGRIFKWIP